ncbi:MAG: hypothetical protein GWM98_19050 [Nitrospinaceae bacterium]|nr:hypothetical protein [Nitrospinaceae bacterium]NIR56193.1 hypothetical protein [Nitrospinaceae bacterium]NIS86649.1 hypothetical protein [Nitrospinaceae bacterium]NIT83482.1 hypothetical protein [Nitrospinaceae bacterium]NIU45687.1 hypothetical protein [Nitrospinaceae bacterium]
MIRRKGKASSGAFPIRKIIYNKSGLEEEFPGMAKGPLLRHILSYCLLFLVSFLIMDSIAVILGVFVGLVGLYHFTWRWIQRNQL